MKNLFTSALIICLFSACLEKPDLSEFNHTKWELTEIPGMTLPQNAKATLNFADSLKITGKSFCNSYGGRAEVTKNKVTLKNIYGTRMFCQETDAAERTYLHNLNQVNMVKIEADKLYLLQGNLPLLVFKRIN